MYFCVAVVQRENTSLLVSALFHGCNIITKVATFLSGLGGHLCQGPLCASSCQQK